MPTDFVYLDHCGSTPTDRRVTMRTFSLVVGELDGTVESRPGIDRKAPIRVEEARTEVASAIGASPREIVFTSGATESVNLAIKGVAERRRGEGRHLVTSVVEHSAVLETCRYLERQGCSVTYLPVDSEGRIDLARLEASLTHETILVALMYANNEVGTIYPVAEIGRIARERGVLFFSDATQAVGKLPVDVRRDGIDLMAFSAHKLYGPPGVGALYVRQGVELEPQMHGGGQERGLRSGTRNVPGIVGFGEACRIAREEGAEEAGRVARLRDLLEGEILARIPGVRVNGCREHRLPNTTNLTFDCVESKELLRMLPHIAMSAGAACATAKSEPSHVLKALGRSDDEARSSVRLSLGRFTTEAEIRYAVDELERAVELLREQSLRWQMMQETV